ncbi:MAG: tetratricopeptide repeat protein [Planctomycetota bacterium]
MQKLLHSISLPRSLSVPFPGALALAAAAALTLSACSSSGERKPGDDLGLTDKEKLGLFLENSFRYFDMGDLDRAQGQARKGLEIDPGNEHFLLIFGRCALLRGTAQDLQVALDTFSRIDNQEDYRVQMSIGSALERKGMFYDEAAIGVRNGSRQTKSADRVARANELSAEARGYWQEAHDHFSRSLAIRSGTSEALNGLVRTSALLGNYSESISRSRELIDSIKASQRLVNNQLDETEISASDESRLFRDRISNRDLEVKTRLHVVNLLRSEERLSEAVDEINEVIALNPDLAQAHSQKAQLLFESGDFVKARASVTRYLEMEAPTSQVTDPDIMQAFDLRERCDRKIVSEG